jgi:hypothetical protein
MIGLVMGGKREGAGRGIGPFHVHRGHVFEGFEVRGGELAALCGCGATLDFADAAFSVCPDCDGDPECVRCGGTGLTVDHAALAWRLPATT